MSKLFSDEAKRAFKTPMFTDKHGRNVYTKHFNEIDNLIKATEIFTLAEGLRLGDSKGQHESGYMYLAVAFYLINHNTPSITFEGEEIPVQKIFHFAGHSFREIGQINRAADAYWRAGVINDKVECQDTFRLRSLARAKQCYSEIGEPEKSDRMHYLEWEARRLGNQSISPILFIWKITSGYGTSFTCWLISVAIFILTFSLTYELFHTIGWISSTKEWCNILTSLYFCIVTTATVGYGEIVPTYWASQVVVTINIVLAYALMAVGVTILGRKVIGS